MPDSDRGFLGVNHRWRRSPRLIALVTWLAIFLVLAAWAMASPVGSGPDESGHIMKAAATVRGQLTGSATEEEGIRSFLLPADVGDLNRVVTCFAGKPDQSAACAPSLGSADSDQTIVLSGVAAYNPVYYAIVGWPSLLWSGTAMVLAMRMLHALLISVLWTLVVVTVPGRSLGSGFILAASLTPMTAYLGGVINPSGVEIAATAAVFALATIVIRQRARVRLWLVLLLAVLALLVCLRSISPLLALCAVVAAAAMNGVRRFWDTLTRRRVLWGIAGLVPVGFFAVTWILIVSGPAGYIPAAGDDRPSPVVAFTESLANFTDYLLQMVGVLGWFDTWLPESVYVVWIAALAGSMCLMLLLSPARSAMIVGAVLATGILLPALLQAATAPEFGYIWQGRYSLPFLALAFTAGAFAVRRQTTDLAVRRFAIGIIVLIAVQVYSFFGALKRFAAGAGAPWAAIWSAYAWHPPIGAWAVIAIFTLGAAILMVLTVARASALRARRPMVRSIDEPAPASSDRRS